MNVRYGSAVRRPIAKARAGPSVGTKPWRATKAEAALRGGPASADAFRAAAAAELADAKPLHDNAFKIELAKRTVSAVLSELAGDAA